MRTLAEPCSTEEEIKRSRFVARAIRLDDPGAAPGWIRRLGAADATHNCWAWRVGARYRSSDDGEPGGTAGRPILAAIEHQGLDCVLVVVTRYFGGIKLGAGGLARAYGGTAARCLREAHVVEVLPTVAVVARVPFEHTGALYGVVERLGAHKLAERWTDAGLEVDLEIREDALEELVSALGDATRGRGRVVREGPAPG